MIAVSDSTPLIHLAKIGCINFLKNLFEKIIIPKEVYEEVIIEGKKQGKNEILLIEKLMEEKFINIEETKTTMEIANLDQGEKKCITLCKELNINIILIDETEGFNISGIFNLMPIRTTSLLIILLDNKIIKLTEYKELLKKLSQSGYFLDSLTYERLLDIGKNIAN